MTQPGQPPVYAQAHPNSPYGQMWWQQQQQQQQQQEQQLYSQQQAQQYQQPAPGQGSYHFSRRQEPQPIENDNDVPTAKPAPGGPPQQPGETQKPGKNGYQPPPDTQKPPNPFEEGWGSSNDPPPQSPSQSQSRQSQKPSAAERYAKLSESQSQKPASPGSAPHASDDDEAAGDVGGVDVDAGASATKKSRGQVAWWANTKEWGVHKRNKLSSVEEGGASPGDSAKPPSPKKSKRSSVESGGGDVGEPVVRKSKAKGRASRKNSGKKSMRGSAMGTTDTFGDAADEGNHSDEFMDGESSGRPSKPTAPDDTPKDDSE